MPASPPPIDPQQSNIPTSELDRPRRIAWWIPVVCLFGVVYFQSLTFVYVEGDDAASMAYHLMGRDESVQPRFAEYQLGMDWVLGFLPPNGPLLRRAGMGITAAAVCLMVVLMITLAFSWLEPKGKTNRTLTAVAVALALPEFFYMGLVYTPMAVGMCFALGGHLTIRRALRHTPDAAGPAGIAAAAAVALAMLVVGTLFRFEVALYGIIIFADLLLMWRIRAPHPGADSRFKPVAYSVIGAGVVAALGIVFMPAALQNAIFGSLHAALATPRFPDGFVGFLGAQQMIATPGALFFGTVGLLSLRKGRRDLLMLVVLAIGCALLWPLWMSPKHVLMFFPPLLLCVLAGAHETLVHLVVRRGRPILAGAAAVLVFLPWFVGLQARAGDSAWGPGFEVRPFNRPYSDEWSIRPVLAAGSAVPTREGPRALWGYSYVLLGGAWREFVGKLDAEERQSIHSAISGRLPLLVLRGGPDYATALLAEAGYARPADTSASELTGLRLLRSVQTGEGGLAILAKADLFGSPDVAGTISAVRQDLGRDTVVALGYPSEIRNHYLVAPAAVRGDAASSATIDLKSLQQAYAARQAAGSEGGARR